MTDLEMTRLCAAAVGYSDVRRKGDAVHDGRGKLVANVYWPLTDDAQAMALVKRLRLSLSCFPMDGEDWAVSALLVGSSAVFTNSNLNRCIVKCVANLQATKEQP